VLITGASGLIGGILRERLPERYTIRAVDRRPRRAPGVRRLDLRRQRGLDAAFTGVAAVIHLGELSSVRTPWAAVSKNNIRGTMNALEAARRTGVRRFVYASSHHVTGMYEEEEPYRSILAGDYAGLDPNDVPLLDIHGPVRPDGPYAIGKVVGEAAARHYSDRYGLQVICLRIGEVKAEDRPTVPRHFATLLSQADLVRLVVCALEAPAEVRFGVYYGVSANTWRFWDVSNGRETIGFEPQDDAERFRDSTDWAG
jgi:uronate dehydrogenase